MLTKGLLFRLLENCRPQTGFILHVRHGILRSKKCHEWKRNPLAAGAYFIDRIGRQSTSKPSSKKTTLQLQRWSKHFHQPDVTARIGQTFYGAYSKEMKANFENDNPRMRLERFHLAACLNDENVFDIFMESGFSLDEDIGISDPWELHRNVLDTYARYFNAATNHTAFAQRLSMAIRFRKGQKLSIEWAANMAARRGCDSLLNAFVQQDFVNFRKCSHILYCLAVLGGHTKTAEKLGRGGTMGPHPVGWLEARFSDPVDGSIHYPSEFLEHSPYSDTYGWSTSNIVPLKMLTTKEPRSDHSTTAARGPMDIEPKIQSTETLAVVNRQKGTSRNLTFASRNASVESATAIVDVHMSQMNYFESILLNKGHLLPRRKWASPVGYSRDGLRVFSVVPSVVDKDRQYFKSWDSTGGALQVELELGHGKTKFSLLLIHLLYRPREHSPCTNCKAVI